jgi:hypothetical protein
LRHNAAEDAINEGVERGVTGEVMSDVNEEAFVRGDWRRESMQDIGECGEGAMP